MIGDDICSHKCVSQNWARKDASHLNWMNWRYFVHFDLQIIRTISKGLVWQWCWNSRGNTVIFLNGTDTRNGNGWMKWVKFLHFCIFCFKLVQSIVPFDVCLAERVIENFDSTVRRCVVHDRRFGGPCSFHNASASWRYWKKGYFLVLVNFCESYVYWGIRVTNWICTYNNDTPFNLQYFVGETRNSVWCIESLIDKDTRAISISLLAEFVGYWEGYYLVRTFKTHCRHLVSNT